jgi:transposase
VASNKRRKYDEVWKAEALRLARCGPATGHQPRTALPLAQFAAEVGTKAVARNLDVRALRARLKRAEQKLKILKNLGK